jgi:hypothetical protein
MSGKHHSTPRACLAAAFALGLSVQVQADDYRWELGLAFDRAMFDGDDVPDTDLLNVGGTFHLQPVRTDGLPLAEAAFLSRSSFLSAGAARFEAGDEKFDVFGANFGYYVPNTIFYGRIGVLKFDDDLGLGDDTNVNATFGIAPFDGLLVTTDFDEDGWNPNVSARYVGKFGNGHYYAAGISAVDPDDDDVNLGISFDYFLDSTFSIGTSIDEHRWTVRAEKFFTPSFAVGVRAYTGDDDEGDGFGATVRWRF